MHFSVGVCSMKDILIYSKYIENARQIESRCSTFYIFLLASWAEPLRYQVWQHLPKSPMALPIECGWKRTSQHETQPNMSMFVHFKRWKACPIPANWLWKGINKWSSERATKPFSLTKYHKATGVGLSSGTSTWCFPLSSIGLVLVPNFWHVYKTSARTWGELQPSPFWFLTLNKSH